MDGILEILAGGGSKTLEIQAGGGVKLEKVFCRGHFDSALSDPENSRNICWRALARQLPILYNSKKKAKSVRCKIEDMRSRLCFLYPGIPGCLWMHVEILIDFEQ